MKGTKNAAFCYQSRLLSIFLDLFLVQNTVNCVYIPLFSNLNVTGVSTLQQLTATLEHQPLYVELLQEVTPGHAPSAQVVLATFETSGNEFLFPYPQLRPTYTSGVDVDLLMEPTRDFPGVIAPKVLKQGLPEGRRSIQFFRTLFLNLSLFCVCFGNDMMGFMQECFRSRAGSLR